MNRPEHVALDGLAAKAPRETLPTPARMGLIVWYAKDFARKVRIFITVIDGDGTEPELPPPLKHLADLQVFAGAQCLHAALLPEFPDEFRFLRIKVKPTQHDQFMQLDVPVIGPGNLPGLGACGCGFGYRGWPAEVLIGLEWLSSVFYDLMDRWGWIGEAGDSALVMPAESAGSIRAKELASLDHAISLLPPDSDLPEGQSIDDALALIGGDEGDWAAPEVRDNRWLYAPIMQSDRLASIIERGFPPQGPPGPQAPSADEHREDRPEQAKRMGVSRQKQIATKAAAIALRIEHPDWDDKAIAEAAGCHVKSLYRWPEYMRASTAEAERRRREMPRGRRDRETGFLEAWTVDEAVH